MKKFTLITFLLLGIFSLFAQTDEKYLDKSPNISGGGNTEATMTPWDLLYNYSFTNFPLSYVAETDGDYFYVGAWDFSNVDTTIRKYDMQGNYIEDLYIPGATKFRDFAFDGTYLYSGLSGSTGVNKIDIYNQTLVETIPTTFKVRALAYDNDLDCFYGNDWSDAIKKFAPDGTLLNTIPLTGTFGSYYGFAYDNWSTGGPYLWGFSQDVSNHHHIVQMKLPSCSETGFVYDASSICWTIAGGLFTYAEPDSGRAVIGGIIQNACLFGLELAPISQPQAYQLGGEISAGSGMLDGGIAELFKMQFNEVTDQYSTNIGTNGSYHFDEVFEGNYILQARPELGSVYMESYAPTYFGGSIHWEDAETIFINASSMNNDINMAEILDPDPGAGYINGNVYDISTDTEIPMADAQIMLLSQSNECMRVLYTDEEGAFDFNDFVVGTYGLLVEIPGKNMEPMSFTLTELEPGLTDVVLYVTDNGISVGTVDNLTTAVKHIGELYPNPAREQATIDIWMEESASLQLRVYSVSGQMVKDLKFDLDKGTNRLNIHLSDMNSGIYYINLVLNGYGITHRKLIKTN